MAHSLSFYAIRSDLAVLLESIESQRPLRYALGGSLLSQYPEVFESSGQLPQLGVAISGDQSREPLYLIVEEGTAIESRNVKQRNGEVRYIVDQQSIPCSVVMRPGGLFNTSAIIAGQIGTTSLDARSKDLFKLIASSFRQQFAKIRSYYVGQEAHRLLVKGMRLTANVLAPPEFDLRKE